MTQTQNKISKDWKETVIGEISSLVKRGITPSYSDAGVYVINQRCIRNNRVSYSEARCTDPDIKKIADEKYLVNGDILICSTGVGTLGRVGQIKAIKDKTTADSHVTIIRLSDKVDKKFVAYFLQGSEKAIEQMAEGTTGQTELPRVKLENFPILLPPLPEQKAIAAVLSSLDDKIELLREENRTLEEMAQVLFKRWFVDFEFPCLPENYKFSGARQPDDFVSICTYKSVGGLPAPQAGKHFLYVLLCGDNSFYIGITNDLYRRWHEHKTGEGAKWTKTNEPIKVIHWEEFDSRQQAAARERELKTGFGRKWLKREYQAGRLRQAGKMVESELGEIPEEWRVDSLDNIAEFLNGLALQKFPPKDKNDEINVVKIRELKNGITEQTDKCSSLIDEKYLIKDGDILFSWSGSLELAIWKYGVGALNQHLFKVTSEKYPKWFYYQWIFYYLNHFREIASSKATTMGHIQRHHLTEAKIVIPDNKIMDSTDKLFSEFIEKIINNNSQIRNISKIRDTLLPKLMRGEIKVVT